MKGCLIPDGNYSGTISGYEVEFLCADNYYMFRVDEGVRGINIPVMVYVINGEYEVEIL